MNARAVDYKDADTLKRFLSPQSKIMARRKTAVCAKHQRKLARAIKRARILGTVPFVTH